jgi:hypothetical protein
LFFLGRLLWQKKKNEISLTEFLFWLFFWLASAFAIVYIKTIDRIVAGLGFSSSGINILFYLIIKMPNLGTVSVYEIFSAILINWFVLGVLLFLIMYFIRGAKKLPKHAFQKVLSSLASFRIPTIIFSIITAVIFLVFLNSFIPVIQAVFQNPALINSTTLFPTLTVFNIIGIILLSLISLFFIVYCIIMFYEFTEIVFDIKNPIGKIVLMILIFVIAILLNSIFL